ncbi:hypothetical protein CLOM_g9187 [Closterium sp. NIES-68]|nr:hypothetical protein CLOM_g9187 [Closterium sp. NIES-68]
MAFFPGTIITFFSESTSGDSPSSRDEAHLVPFPVNDLPDDVLAVVLRLVSRRSIHLALQTVNPVCKRWSRLLRLALAHVAITREITPTGLLSALRTFYTISHVDIAEDVIVPPLQSPLLQDDLVRRIAATCPHLKSFALAHQSRAEGQVSPAGLSALFRECPRLESLRLLPLSAIPALPPAVSLLTSLSALELGEDDAWCWGEGGKQALAEGGGGGNAGGCWGSNDEKRIDGRWSESGGLSYGAMILSARIKRQRDSSLTSLATSASHLESLSVLAYLRVNSWCLQALPSSLAALKMLSHLEVSSEKVSVLPEEICDLPVLQVLRLRLRKLSHLPEKLGSLVSLQQLRLRDCTCLLSLPDTFGQLRLKLLELHNCASLTALPHDFGSLSQLQTLRLIWVYHLSNLPDSFGQLSSLRSLELEQCTALQVLPGPIDFSREGQVWLPALEKLRLVGLRHLDTLPPLGQLTKLRRLTVSLLWKLEELPPSLSLLSNLHILVVHGCPMLKSLPPNVPSSLPSLTSLAIVSCPSFRELETSSAVCGTAREACGDGGDQGGVDGAEVRCEGQQCDRERCDNVEVDLGAEAAAVSPGRDLCSLGSLGHGEVGGGGSREADGAAGAGRRGCMQPCASAGGFKGCTPGAGQGGKISLSTLSNSILSFLHPSRSASGQPTIASGATTHPHHSSNHSKPSLPCLSSVYLIDTGIKALPGSLMQLSALQCVHHFNHKWMGSKVAKLPKGYPFERQPCRSDADGRVYVRCGYIGDPCASCSSERAMTYA